VTKCSFSKMGDDGVEICVEKNEGPDGYPGVCFCCVCIFFFIFLFICDYIVHFLGAP
jgi:hypothetical protein